MGHIPDPIRHGGAGGLAMLSYLLVASWTNYLLYTLEIALIVEYFQQSSRPLLHRIGVICLFAFDTVCTGAVFIEVYFDMLGLLWQASLVFDTTLRAVAVILFSTYATAALEQLFLCTLYFSLTKKWLIAAFLVAWVAAHLSLCFRWTLDLMLIPRALCGDTLVFQL
ncbi:hypothetical protein C8R44DRAFT_864965 [Mycena epipterygia]|nr:hypothetical protein C8R44DRAFT_864965 [Mycena epipterygia]